jgi:hypothetical protein
MILLYHLSAHLTWRKVSGLSSILAFTLLNSCGSLGLFKSGEVGSEASTPPLPSETPPPENPPIPPVPVIGSYLTAALFTENFQPVPTVKLITEKSRQDLETNEAGVVHIPIETIEADEIRLTLSFSGKQIPIRIVVPQNIATKLSEKRGNPALLIDRALGIEIDKALLDAAQNGSLSVLTHYEATSYSLPTIDGAVVSSAAPILNFQILSHNDFDKHNAGSLLTLSGKCEPGFKVKVTGDTLSPAESFCVDSGAGGEFTVEVNLTEGDELKTLELTHSEPNSDRFVTQRLRFVQYSCSAGYVRVPASGLEQLGHKDASTTHSDWWLNTSRDFCVMKYTAQQNGTLPLSAPEGAPWTNITQADATAACSSLGPNYRLISNTQWQTIARNVENVAYNWSSGTAGVGVIAKGHSDNDPPKKLEASADFAAYFGTGNSSNDTPGAGWEQRRTLMLSNGEVLWDFSGNVRHWMSDPLPSLGLTSDYTGGWGWVELSDTTKFPASGINRSILGSARPLNSAHAIGQIYMANASYLVRGGSFWEMDKVGPYSTSSYNPAGDHVGFRCVSKLNP